MYKLDMNCEKALGGTNNWFSDICANDICVK